jgi:hypothetical protein
MPAPTKKNAAAGKVAKAAKGSGKGAGDKRERKPAMKRGGKGGGGGGGGGSSGGGEGGGRGGGGLSAAKVAKGKNAAHHQQSYYDVDEEADDFAGRGAAMADEFRDAKVLWKIS